MKPKMTEAVQMFDENDKVQYATHYAPNKTSRGWSKQEDSTDNEIMLANLEKTYPLSIVNEHRRS